MGEMWAINDSDCAIRAQGRAREPDLAITAPANLADEFVVRNLGKRYPLSPQKRSVQRLPAEQLVGSAPYVHLFTATERLRGRRTGPCP